MVLAIYAAGELKSYIFFRKTRDFGPIVINKRVRTCIVTDSKTRMIPRCKGGGVVADDHSSKESTDIGVCRAIGKGGTKGLAVYNSRIVSIRHKSNQLNKLGWPLSCGVGQEIGIDIEVEIRDAPPLDAQ